MLLLLLSGLIFISAAWAVRYIGMPYETLPHRRQLLLLRLIAKRSELVTRLLTTYGKPGLETVTPVQKPPSPDSFTEESTSGGNSSTSQSYRETDRLHMRRHVRPDYYLERVTPKDPPRVSTSSTNTEVCVAIASMPRVFPEKRKLPPWHFPVSLLRLLEQRRSPPDRSDGFKDMRVVVYSSGCSGEPEPGGVAKPARIAKPARVAKPARFADPARATPEASDNGQSTYTRNVTQGLDQQPAPAPPGDVETGNQLLLNKGMVGAKHQQALELAARNSSLKIDVLPPRRDVCDFVRQGEEALRNLGITGVPTNRWKAWRWRTKLVMDFVYVMRQCMATGPKYILLLQDDTKPARLYDIGIERFINDDLKGKEWTVLSLYYPQSYLWPYRHGGEYFIPCCAQALLFNVTSLEDLLGFVEQHFTEAPMDWILSLYLTSSNQTGFVHVPSLFQHVGDVRTKAPGVVSSTHRDWNFRDDYVVNLPRGAGSTRDENVDIGEGSAELELRRQPLRAYPVEAFSDTGL
ncbi:hypothetical protein CLOM_g7205 [Closterium sp. NIES-68]|nr:hypothetical protein CLOM_g7205 [Closterium sp. NIES-68]GJP60473.1 hypothetical protein CLOP_g17689 [Closterium sp. NIES-67]